MREKMMNKDYAKAFKTIVIMAVLLALLSAVVIPLSLGGIAVLWLALGIYYWLLVAAWLYKSAVNEGMNKSLWMILGLFTNLLAVIAFLIVRDNPRRVKPQAAQ